MRKKFVQIAAVCLATSLLFHLSGTLESASASASHGGDQIVEIGIYFGSGTLPGVNIANREGEGFRLGYYQEDDTFVQLASTSETDISIVKAMNVYLYSYYSGGNATYYDYNGQETDSVVIGEYHLRLPGTYGTYEEALAVASEYEDGFVSYVDGEFQARVGNYAEREDAVAAQDSMAMTGVSAELCGSSSVAVNVVRSGTNEILFQYDGANGVAGLAVEPNAAGEQGEDYTTRFHSINWRGGFCFERFSGGDLTISNVLSLDDYVKGVIPHEMSSSWPLEALKAQAVCARTYALRLMGGSRHSGQFDLCNESHCQVYLGTSGAGTNSDRAVEETAGMVATYNGAYIDAVYYSSNGGASMDSSVVWGGSQSSYPYLVGVTDPYEAAVADRISGYEWTRTYTGEELRDVVREAGYQTCETVVSVSVRDYSSTGLPWQITFTDEDGRSFTISTRALVSSFGLRSYNYTITGGGSSGGQLMVNGQPVDSLDGLYAIGGDGNISAIGGGAYVIDGNGDIVQAGSGGGSSSSDGVFTISGAGWGHNVGMSQWGAYAQALEGRTYLQILTFYYTGITVERFENI